MVAEHFVYSRVEQVQRCLVVVVVVVVGLVVVEQEELGPFGDGRGLNSDRGKLAAAGAIKAAADCDDQ